MVNYIKKFTIRLIISILIITLLMFMGEFILKCIYSNDWYHENKIINNMNIDKLQNKNWDYNPLWIHEGEDIPTKKEGSKRIFIVGDSYIWGDGYSNANHIWWQQFRHLLKESGYNNVEVYAAGITGYSTKQQLELILKNKEIMKKVDPDLIVIGYVTNDPEFRDENNNLLVKFLESERIFNYLDNQFIKMFTNEFPNLYQRFSMLISNKFYNNNKFREIFGLNWNQWTTTISSGMWLEKYEKEVLVPLDEYITNELNIPYFFYTTNSYDDPAISNVINSFQKYGIKYYSLYNIISEFALDVTFDSKYSKINPVNWHPSVRDCKIYAESIFKVFEKYYPNILGEKNGTYKPTLNINDWLPYSLQPKKSSDNSYIISYPSKNSKNSFLYLPVNKNYVKLNLEDPLDIENIEIIGEDIEEIEIFVNCIDKQLEFDTQEMFSLGIQKGQFSWSNINIKNITSINISAKIKKGKSSKLTIIID